MEGAATVCVSFSDDYKQRGVNRSLLDTLTNVVLMLELAQRFVICGIWLGRTSQNTAGLGPYSRTSYDTS